MGFAADKTYGLLIRDNMDGVFTESQNTFSAFESSEGQLNLIIWRDFGQWGLSEKGGALNLPILVIFLGSIIMDHQRFEALFPGKPIPLRIIWFHREHFGNHRQSSKARNMFLPCSTQKILGSYPGVGKCPIFHITQMNKFCFVVYSQLTYVFKWCFQQVPKP